MTRSNSIEIGCVQPLMSTTSCSLDGMLDLEVTGSDNVLKLSGGLLFTSKSASATMMRKSHFRSPGGRVVMQNLSINKLKVSTQTAMSIEAKEAELTDVDISDSSTKFAGFFLELINIRSSAKIKRVRFKSIESSDSLISAYSDAAFGQNLGTFDLQSVTCDTCVSMNKNIIEVKNFDNVKVQTLNITSSSATKESLADISFASGGNSRLIDFDGLDIKDTLCELSAIKISGSSSMSFKNSQYSGNSDGGFFMTESQDMRVDVKNVTVAKGSSKFKSTFLFSLLNGRSSSIAIDGLKTLELGSAFSIISVQSSASSGKKTDVKLMNTLIDQSTSNLESFVNFLNTDANVTNFTARRGTSAGPMIAVTNSDTLRFDGLLFKSSSIQLGSAISAKNGKDIVLSHTTMESVNCQKGSAISIQGNVQESSSSSISHVTITDSVLSDSVISNLYTSSQMFADLSFQRVVSSQQIIVVESFLKSSLSQFNNLFIGDSQSQSSNLISTSRTSPNFHNVALIRVSSQKSAFEISDSNDIFMRDLKVSQYNSSRGNLIKALTNKNELKLQGCEFESSTLEASVIATQSSIVDIGTGTFTNMKSNSGAMIYAYDNLMKLNLTSLDVSSTTTVADTVQAIFSDSTTLNAQLFVKDVSFSSTVSSNGATLSSLDANTVNVSNYTCAMCVNKHGVLSFSRNQGYQDLILDGIKVDQSDTTTHCKNEFSCGDLIHIDNARKVSIRSSDLQRVYTANGVFHIRSSL